MSRKRWHLTKLQIQRFTKVSQFVSLREHQTISGLRFWFVQSPFYLSWSSMVTSLFLAQVSDFSRAVRPSQESASTCMGHRMRHSLYILPVLFGLIAAEFLPDDECSEGGCALNALQVQQRQLSVADPEIVTSCANETMCDSNRTCVFKEDRTWSQCVPLDHKTFQKECGYWDRKMRLAAIAATKMQCDSVKCEWDQDSQLLKCICGVKLWSKAVFPST